MLEYQSEGGSGGGDRTPILKFSAMGGDFIVVDRVQENGKWTNNEKELILPVKVAMDMEALELGYIGYKPAPDFRMVRVGETPPEKPADLDANGNPLFKWGFRVRLCNKEIGLRELSSTSKNVYAAMQTIYKEYMAGSASNPGLVPVVEIAGTERKVQKLNDGQSQTWRVPQWSVVGWTKRPVALGGEGAPEEPAPAMVAPPLAATPPAAPEAGGDIF